VAQTRSGVEAGPRSQPPSPIASAAMPIAAEIVVRTTSGNGAWSRSPRPDGLSVKTNGTRNAGSVYFQVSIIVRNGFAPVIAAAAKADSAVGGLTSERTA